MERYDNSNVNEEQNDEFTGQSASRDSEDFGDLEDKWYEIEDDYRTRYSDLTDEDVEIRNGGFDETLGRISRRRGKTRSEIRREIENW